MRTIAIDDLLKKARFSQVISIGSGFDTRRDRLSIPRYYELDLPRLNKLKPKHPYTVSMDLRETHDFIPLLHDFDSTLPTAILFECVLMYLTPEVGDGVISYAKESIPNITFITFDAVLQNTNYGSKMLDNLQQRLTNNLPSLTHYRTVDSQMARFGMPYHNARLLSNLESEYLKSMSAFPCLQLDEREEWDLVTQHYALIISSNMEQE